VINVIIDNEKTVVRRFERLHFDSGVLPVKFFNIQSQCLADAVCKDLGGYLCFSLG
jgi:hypothetical protein